MMHISKETTSHDCWLGTHIFPPWKILPIDWICCPGFPPLCLFSKCFMCCVSSLQRAICILYNVFVLFSNATRRHDQACYVMFSSLYFAQWGPSLEEDCWELEPLRKSGGTRLQDKADVEAGKHSGEGRWMGWGGLMCTAYVQAVTNLTKWSRTWKVWYPSAPRSGLGNPILLRLSNEWPWAKTRECAVLMSWLLTRVSLYCVNASLRSHDMSHILWHSS